MMYCADGASTHSFSAVGTRWLIWSVSYQPLSLSQNFLSTNLGWVKMEDIQYLFHFQLIAKLNAWPSWQQVSVLDTILQHFPLYKLWGKCGDVSRALHLRQVRNCFQQKSKHVGFKCPSYKLVSNTPEPFTPVLTVTNSMPHSTLEQL